MTGESAPRYKGASGRYFFKLENAWKAMITPAARRTRRVAWSEPYPQVLEIVVPFSDCDNE
jgi:hypothetical protein